MLLESRSQCLWSMRPYNRSSPVTEHIITVRGPQSQRKSSSADAPVCKDREHKLCNLSSYCAAPQPLCSASCGGKCARKWHLHSMLHKSRCSVRRRPPPRHIPRGRGQLACSPGFLATQRPTTAPKPRPESRARKIAISHFRNARRHSAAATFDRTRAIKSLKSSTQPCRRARAPQAPCARAMRSCRWGGVRRASGREMGSGAARVGGADPGARGGRTRGTLKRRTGCPGSAPRCAARPIPPHPRRPPPSALDFNPFKTKKITDLRAILTAPHPVPKRGPNRPVVKLCPPYLG